MEFIESLYGVILPTHIIAVIVTVAIIICSDVYGTLWVFGKKELLNPKLIKRFHDYVWIGLGVILLTGLGLFLPYKSYLLSNSAFLIKMMFVLFLSINAFFIGAHMYVATTQTFKSLTLKERAILMISGFVSVGGWTGAIISSFYIGL